MPSFNNGLKSTERDRHFSKFVQRLRRAFLTSRSLSKIFSFFSCVVAAVEVDSCYRARSFRPGRGVILRKSAPVFLSADPGAPGPRTRRLSESKLGTCVGGERRMGQTGQWVRTHLSDSPQALCALSGRKHAPAALRSSVRIGLHWSFTEHETNYRRPSPFSSTRRIVRPNGGSRT